MSSGMGNGNFSTRATEYCTPYSYHHADMHAWSLARRRHPCFAQGKTA